MSLNFRLIENEVREFLLENLHANPAEISLKKSPFNGVSSKELAQQLIGLQKSRKKLPTWLNNEKVIFPPKINLEQTSSEQAAEYKANLVSGKKLLDATGGFGIDSFYFSKKVKTIIHCELNESLQELAQHNFGALGCNNVKSYHENGIKLALDTPNIDWLYIDPSRRNEAKGKVFFLKDCEPNVTEILDDCLAKIPNILIKTAPILDISVGLAELKQVKSIHIVAVNNEVKELLWHIESGFEEQPKMIAVNISKKIDNVEVGIGAEEFSQAKIGQVSNYLYEPFSAVMKTGAFKWLSQQFGVFKLHEHSHLYTSEDLISFPGKVFKVIQTQEFNKKNMKLFMGSHANVVTRNFKQSVNQIRTKFKIKESENRYLFFTTNSNNKSVVVECEKL